jgi:hypothetical protein
MIRKHWRRRKIAGRTRMTLTEFVMSLYRRPAIYVFGLDLSTTADRMCYGFIVDNQWSQVQPVVGEGFYERISRP